jgi:hypothetical protein
MNTRPDYDQNMLSRPVGPLRQVPLCIGILQSRNGSAERGAVDETIEQSFPASGPPSTDPNPDSDTEKFPDARERDDGHG